MRAVLFITPSFVAKAHFDFHWLTSNFDITQQK